MIDRGIPRHGYKVFSGEEEIGEVTTGTQSPTLKKNIGLALLNKEFTILDTEVSLKSEGKSLKQSCSETPFYKRTKK